MLAVVLGVIPGMFGLFLWNAYRSNRTREAEGRGYRPRSGAQRWDAVSDPAETEVPPTDSPTIPSGGHDDPVDRS